jgi:hypothetical protein
VIAKHQPDQSNDSVNLIVSLLVRHPEISRVVIKPRFAAIALFFIVREPLGDNEQRSFRAMVSDHLHAYHRLVREPAPRVDMRLRPEGDITFIEVERDARTVAREEISLIVALVAQTFGDRLIVNPPVEQSGDEDFATQEDAVASALDAVRRDKQRKGLVGLREERRVLIYFD